MKHNTRFSDARSSQFVIDSHESEIHCEFLKEKLVSLSKTLKDNIDLILSDKSNTIANQYNIYLSQLVKHIFLLVRAFIADYIVNILYYRLKLNF